MLWLLLKVLLRCARWLKRLKNHETVPGGYPRPFSLLSESQILQMKRFRILPTFLWNVSIRPRPVTSASMAKRLVSTALGIRNTVSPEQRKIERQMLADAKGLDFRSFKKEDPES